jgi:hypothetical protein
MSTRFLRASRESGIAYLRPPAPSLTLQKKSEGPAMPDLVYTVLALGVFALFALAVEGCERL